MIFISKLLDDLETVRAGENITRGRCICGAGIGPKSPKYRCGTYRWGRNRNIENARSWACKQSTKRRRQRSAVWLGVGALIAAGLIAAVAGLYI